MTSGTLYLNAEGNAVEWVVLDDAERRFYSHPPPWIVTEFGMSIAEYVAKLLAELSRAAPF